MMITTLFATLLLSATQVRPLPEGTDVVRPDALTKTPVSMSREANASVKILPEGGPDFTPALRVTVGRSTPETNAVQLTLLNTAPVTKDDVLLAQIWVRGRTQNGDAARLELLFEKSTDPWTKSANTSGAARQDNKWSRVQMAVRSIANYSPGEAMFSIRLALAPQIIEIAEPRVTNLGNKISFDELSERLSLSQAVGESSIKLHFDRPRQTMIGFGGNFCQPRYGTTEPMDVVGQYALDNLKVAHARVGFPLNHWNPEPGNFREAAQARAALQAMQLLAERKIPIVLSVWEGPGWMLGGRPEQQGRTLPERNYDAMISATTRFLKLAATKYNAPVDYFSFNEPDYGVNFKFTSEQMIGFIAKAGPAFKAAGLKTKFLVADTANGANFPAYAGPILADPKIAPYLGPLSFHSWDALHASEEVYRSIAALGRKHKKQVWCLEAGHDPQLWQQPDPWSSWDNALRTAQAYERTIRLTESSLMDYWTYQDNYALVDGKSGKPFRVFRVMQQMEQIFPKGAVVVDTSGASEGLQIVATKLPGKSLRWRALMVNPIGRGYAIFSGQKPGTTIRVFTSTAETQQLPSQLKVGRNGQIRVPVPARSVVTIHAG